MLETLPSPDELKILKKLQRALIFPKNIIQKSCLSLWNQSVLKQLRQMILLISHSADNNSLLTH